MTPTSPGFIPRADYKRKFFRHRYGYYRDTPFSTAINDMRQRETGVAGYQIPLSYSAR